MVALRSSPSMSRYIWSTIDHKATLAGVSSSISQWSHRCPEAVSVTSDGSKQHRRESHLEHRLEDVEGLRMHADVEVASHALHLQVPGDVAALPARQALLQLVHLPPTPAHPNIVQSDPMRCSRVG